MDTGIEVQLWNILKYVLLTLLLAPIAENAISRITAWRHAYLVHHGEAIRLKSSALGNIALHQEVETLHVWSRVWQVFSILLALGIALPFEYSSGAQSQLVWSEQPSFSMSVPANDSDERILLALDNPAQQQECVNPARLADVGEFIFLQPSNEKPPYLNGTVTLDTLNTLIFDPTQNWSMSSLNAQFGDGDIQLYAGGRAGQQAIITDPNKEGEIVADFESDLLCKGFLEESFTCYDMAGQLTLSQLAYSVGSLLGGSLFLRTQFENAAKLFRFKAGLVTNSIGDPSLEQNLLDQAVNESGYQWLVRARGEDGRRPLSISTIKLDSQVRSTSCQLVGSVPIRPLRLQVGETLSGEGEPLEVNMSATGDLKFVKIGNHLMSALLTRTTNGWICATNGFTAVCVSASERKLYYLSKGSAVYEYYPHFVLRVRRSIEDHADLAVLLLQSVSDIMQNGGLAPWDLRNLLPGSRSSVEGARSITARADASVAVSSGMRVTGTIEIWATALYCSLLVLFSLTIVLFRIKPLPNVDIERMYWKVVWEKESAVDSSETPNTAPTIGLTAAVDGVGMLTASYTGSKS